jgi:(E)-4-hydroxy-3-methylbut-2-enyl-diphosphate synthase
MRIGVNAGSLERDLLERYGEHCPEAMVESALTQAKILNHEAGGGRASAGAGKIVLRNSL